MLNWYALGALAAMVAIILILSKMGLDREDRLWEEQVREAFDRKEEKK